MANYRCVFASYGRGKYICCSKPKKPRGDGDDLLTNEPDEYEDNYGQQAQSTRPPSIPPPPRPVQNGWTQPAIDPSRWTTVAPWTQNNNNNWNNNYGGGNWNTGNYGNWNGNWDNNAQGWIANRASGQQPNWGNNAAAWGNYANANQGWGGQYPVWNNQQPWNNYNGYANANTNMNTNMNTGTPTQMRRELQNYILGTS